MACGWLFVTGSTCLANDDLLLVYERLGRTIGQINELPALRIDPTNAKGAAAFVDFNKTRTEIVVEAGALEICNGFGAQRFDAMALLLGHELGHFAVAAGWGWDFIEYSNHAQTKVDVAKVLSTSSTYGFFEMQADQRGAFLSYLAGFDPGGVSDSLFVRLYRFYKWRPDMARYPALNDRLELLRKGVARAQEFMLVQRLANLHAALGGWEEALGRYELLLSEGFTNPMLLNNTAACHLQLAIQHFEATDTLPYLPIELDLRENWRSGLMERRVLRDRHLSIARRRLLEVMAIDPGNPTIIVNMACWAILAGEYEEAAMWSQRLLRAPNPVRSSHVILQGCIAIRRGDHDAAVRAFSDPSLAGNWIAKRNLAILSGDPGMSSDETSGLSVPAATFERIGGKDIRDLFEGSDPKPVRFRGEDLLYHSTIDGAWCASSGHPIGIGKTRYTYAALMKPGYQGATGKGLRIGSMESEVVSRYGAPERITQLENGRMLVYARQGISFILNHDGSLSSWLVFLQITA
jgi:hypothetical protein